MNKITTLDLDDIIKQMIDKNSKAKERKRFGAILESKEAKGYDTFYFSYEDMEKFTSADVKPMESDVLAWVDLYTGDVVSLRFAYETAMKKLKKEES